MTLLAPLYEQALIRSQQRLESHRLLTDELCDYKLRWSGQADVDTSLYGLRTPNLALYALSYGDEVDCVPQTYDGFALVHYAKRGPIEITTDGRRESLAPGEVALSSPRRSVSLRWSADCEQVILRVPLTLLRQSWTGTHASASGTGLQPLVRLGGAASKIWLNQLESLANYAAFQASHSTGSSAETAWLTHVERAMAAFLAVQAELTPKGSDEVSGGRGQGCRPGWRQERLKRWERVIERVLCEPATLAILAGHMALSPRQLSEWTQEQFGMSPMAWLRVRRLEAVRRALQTEPAPDVTSVALAHGFGHLGRFAQLYREYFGEYPSQTKSVSSRQSEPAYWPPRTLLDRP